MNAAVIATAPHYRPQLGVGVSSTLTQNPSNGSVLERDQHPTVTSPLSPSSDFSFSKYQTDNTYPNQQQQQRGQMGFANPNLNALDGAGGAGGRGGGGGALSQSGSNLSLGSNRSEGSFGERDSVVMEHYMRLKNYLTRQYSVDGLNQRQNKAREKLIRLSKQQFNELSTDVYDELMRRQNTQKSFHPKRNQARQKLATLPPTRFKELASDVLYEIERRYPMVVDSATNSQQYLNTDDNTVPRTQSTSSLGSQRSDQSYNQPYTPRNDSSFPSSASRDRFPSSTSSNNLASTPIPEEPEDTDPVQRSGMQNTIIPNKSTMVEEDLPDYDEPESLNRSTSRTTPEKKTFMANTIVPNTSTMVEEDTDDDLQTEQQRGTSILAPSTIGSTKSLSPPVFKSNAFSNANGSRTRSISPPPVLPKSRAQIEEQARREQQVQDKMDEYEDQIEALKERIAELQGELRSVKSELQQERSKPPPTPPPPPPQTNDRRLRDLEEENALLKEELREQQEVTNDVRREATELLEEMKLLTTQQETYFDTHTTSTREISRLNAELRDWKSRYSQLKIQLKSHTRSSPSSSQLSTPTTITSAANTRNMRALPTSEDGYIEQTSLARFQNAIDELLAAARREDGGEVMETMTEVVKATRGISDDVRRFTPATGAGEGGGSERVKKLTTRLSATANNLITATKNFVGSGGISPVSLVDAAASHLTSTVVELCKLVKLRPSGGGGGGGTASFDDNASDRSRLSELATPLTSPLAANISPAHSKPAALNLGSRSNLAPRTSSGIDPSTMGGYRSPDSPLSNSQLSPAAVQEEQLRVYLDTQTRNIVESIQSLLTRIRNPKLDSPDDFRGQIDEITGIVEQIIEYTDRQGGKIERFGRGEDNGRLMGVLRSLEDCCGSMRSIAGPSSNSEDGFKKRLARIAFDISKQIKELVRIVESESPLSSGNDLT